MATQKTKSEFDKEVLWSTVIAIPLQKNIQEDIENGVTAPRKVVIDLNLDCRGGREGAKNKVRRLIEELGLRINEEKSSVTEQYVFADLPGRAIRELVALDHTKPFIESDLPTGMTAVGTTPGRTATESEYVRVDQGERMPPYERAIYRIWPDFEIRVRISRSVSTIKADAAHRSFSALGRGIVWAVMDSGIARHLHFGKFQNLEVAAPLAHKNFVDSKADADADPRGHGTHVAGIIAGYLETTNGPEGSVVAAMSESRDEEQRPHRSMESLPRISGMAPECKLVSLRVLDDSGRGNVSNLIAAINYVQEVNGYGRRLLIHGVNMSLGYDFDPEWFACGQSPLCVEVDRLVRSGVVVVVAAGNSGFIYKQGLDEVTFAAGETLTINDPGNADLAITVGSTHRDMPHMYGVSYFSSKGPTGDGRLKPDLLAPGEKILSCAAGEKIPPEGETAEFLGQAKKKHGNTNVAWYVQDSGTSMAAPHVSGAIAAFLSIRREFIGRPDEIKKIFLGSATDLKRERYFQGNGLVDLMRAIQSV